MTTSAWAKTGKAASKLQGCQSGATGIETLQVRTGGCTHKIYDQCGVQGIQVKGGACCIAGVDARCRLQVLQAFTPETGLVLKL